MERTKNWYSIIQYVPNNLRGEIINIGCLLHNPSSGSIKYDILPADNSKLRGIIENDIALNTYKVNKDIFEEFINAKPENFDLLTLDHNTDSFLKQINDILPEEFIITPPSYSMTSDENQLFKNLTNTYVGNSFFKKEQRIKKASTKIYVRDTFKEYELIGKKIKPNVKIYPFKNLKKVPFIIDFVYKNGKINLLQTVPSDEEKLTNWFSQALTITESLDKTGLYYLFDSEAEINSDRSVSQMIDLLKSKGPSVQGVDIAGDNLHSLCKQVQENGKDIVEFEEELVAI